LHTRCGAGRQSRARPMLQFFRLISCGCKTTRRRSRFHMKQKANKILGIRGFHF
jgi:hypothetical protein